jgi:DNA helicase IV
MSDYLDLKTSEFARLLRSICPFDGSLEWELEIEALVTHEEQGEGVVERAFLDGDGEHIKLAVTFAARTHYRLWEFVSTFSVVRVSLLTLKMIGTVSAYEEAVQDLDRRKREEERKRLAAEQVEREQRKRALRETLEPLFDGDTWHPVDSFLAQNPGVDIDLFHEIKCDQVREFLGARLDDRFREDAEKARALANSSPRFLLKARAGSGKTSVIGMKTVLLVERYGTHPDQIMILAFNRAAADEIGSRVRDRFGLPGFRNARTFHSLANRIARPSQEILSDQGPYDEAKDLSRFVQETVRFPEIWNPLFWMKMYLFFREELKEIERVGAHLSSEDYLIFRRNLTQLTLRGEWVKSAGEKFIADFLFEHSLRHSGHDLYYQYEDLVLVPREHRSSFGNTYRPDFKIYAKGNRGSTFWLEHWGIDERDSQQRAPPGMDWEEYRKQMGWKREFWRRRGETLIETSIVDMIDGREAFEGILKRRLEEMGIECHRQPDEAISESLKGSCLTRMTKLFVQFIQGAKKQLLSSEEMRKKVEEFNPTDARTRVFLDLACKVYEVYQSRLEASNMIDFDDLVTRAVDRIHETRGKCEISIGGNPDDRVRMNDLRYLLIDEYQDFSELFHRIVMALRQHNPRLEIFSVGDDWQAINSFMGSELSFFQRFEDYFKDGSSGELLTNYRSCQRIVELSNRIMRGKGAPSRCQPGQVKGSVTILYPDEIWLKRNPPDDKADSSKDATPFDDRRFLLTTRDGKPDFGRWQTAQYLKTCHGIISDHREAEEMLILTRTNKFPDGTSIEDFLAKLKSCFPSEQRRWFSERVRGMTAHRSKGQEADVVIVLRAVIGAFPLIHPDSILFEIFGRSAADAIDEERRLFYVACTRAKEHLYIVTEQDRESDFLGVLGVRPRSPQRR